MSLTNKTILIDPGHGGHDPGVISGSTYEKNITLSVANKLKNILVAKGAIVYLTRPSDSVNWTNVNSRVQYINAQFRDNYHAMVCLHVNTPTGIVGTFYQLNNPATLARNIAASMGKPAYSENYAILRDTMNDTKPKALVEMGNISDPKLLTSTWVTTMAGTIAAGIEATV